MAMPPTPGPDPAGHRRAGSRPARRTTWLTLAGIAMLQALGCQGCRDTAPTAPKGHLFAILVDRSSSAANDRTIHLEAMRRILAKAEAGDRIVIAPITAVSGRDFTTAIDRELPPRLPEEGLLTVAVQYRKAKKEHAARLEETKKALEAEAEAFVSTPGHEPRTSIVESLDVVAPMLRDGRRDATLVILSDMVEDSGVANLEKAQIDDQFIDRQIARFRQEGILPALQGVSVYAAGVVASPPAKSASIERFWRRFFQEAGAQLRSYGRNLFEFER